MMTMKWTVEYQAFEAASGQVLVNSSPDAWCLVECDPAAMRAAADEVARICLQPLPAGLPDGYWIDLVEAVPCSGKPTDVQRWIERCMTDGSDLPSSRLLLSILRARGIILWPVAVAFGTRPWGCNVPPKFLTGEPRARTGFEEGLLATGRVVTKTAVKALLMSCSPVEHQGGLSVPALLHALEVVTGSSLWAAAESDAKTPRLWLVPFRTISQRASKGDEVGLAAAERAEVILQRARERCRQATVFGPFACRPDAQEVIEAFRMVNLTIARKGSATILMGQRSFVNYLGSTYETIPRLGEMTREEIVLGPNGLVGWLERSKASRCMAHETMSRVVELFEELCDRGLVANAPVRITDVPSSGYGSSATDKLVVPREVMQAAEHVLMEFCETALRQGEELGDGDWRPVREAANCLPADLPDGSSLLPSGLARPEAIHARIVTLRTSDGRHARILDPSVPLILLYLHRHPHRTIQARLADSGEFDEMVPVLEDSRDGEGLLSIAATWHRNPNPLAVAGRREGVIREIRDRVAGDAFLGFWISSNKSQEGGHADGQDRGFESPVEDPVLTMLLWRLARLNQRINPVDRLLSRDELGDLRLKPSSALDGLMPKYVYLFRSGANLTLAHRLAPPTHAVLMQSYVRVLDEVEGRLRREDAVEADSLRRSERKIITGRSEWGAATASVYGLHGLRVTGLTSMVRHGVPFWAISRMVAGHTNFKMTMRYIKVEAGDVRSALAKAASASSMEELWHEAQRAAACTPEELTLKYASDQPGPVDGSRQPAGFWLARHDGICPNAETACSTGGSVVPGSMLHGPVQGGARNCPLCRHFLTGPKFLPGQVDLFNAGLFRARRQSEGLRELRRAHLDADSPISRARLDDRIARAEAELDVTVKTLNARYRLLKKSEALAALDERGDARPDGTEGDLLITRSSPDEVALNLRLTSELGFLDTVARVAALVPEIAIQDAILERNLLIDRLLDRDGYEGLCYRLPQPEAAVAGDAFLDGVRAQAEPATDPDRFVDDVWEGSRRLFTLDMDGVAAEVSMAVGRTIPIRRRPALARSNLTLGGDE